MSEFQNEQDYDYENEPCISEELQTLLEIRNHLEMQITILNEKMAFAEALDGSFTRGLSPFINSFTNEFKEQFPITIVEKDLQAIDKMMTEVVQQIKGVCKHQYEEDHIDMTEGCCEESKKITYCLICYSTF
jgi:hypothetical protein